LGELNKEGLNKDTLKKSDFNLRCMKIIKDQAHQGMGYITKDSNPRKEWEERKQQIDDYEKRVL
jgi:hypothetical protein